ncbi:MAG: type II CRISPR RNA-guided endonuclease Cas9 [Ruthenibacterium sp.]
MKYGIGLDIGIASVGFAVIGLNQSEKPIGIIRMGTRIFDKAEQPKTGESLAAPRREARSMRRRLRRHRHRLERIRKLLVDENVLSEEELENLYAGKALEDIYALRTRALDELLTPSEFARVLLHLAQRRGFKSNRKSDASDKDAGKLLSAVQQNQMRMQEKGYRTVGEMFYRDDIFSISKRNKNENYLATVQRDMIADEVSQIFAAQNRLQNAQARAELQAQYLTILLSQRNFDDGPGGNSPYSGNQIEKMIGSCVFEIGEPRAAKACYSFEYFNLLQKVNHIRILQEGSGRPLNKAERDAIVSLAFQSADVSFARIRKEIGLEPNEMFNGLRYSGGKTIEEIEKKEKLQCMKAYHQMRKTLDKVSKGHIAVLSHTQLNAIGTALSMFKSEEKIKPKLQEAALQPFEVEALLTLPSFSGFGHLSVKACDKIIPFLEQGMTYDKACEAAGYRFKGHEQEEKYRVLPPNMPEMEDITSPVVRRAIAQTIKVVNAIIRTQDASPSFVHIELAREMSKDFNERRQIDKSMQENAALNERIMNRIRTEFGQINPTGQDLVKLKLYEQQGGVCAYSLCPLQIEQLFTPGYVEIDHIIPYSIAFDDSYKNKVLVLTRENQHKGNRLPLQYLAGEQRERFIVWTNNNVRDYRKRQNLLKETITEEDRNKFKERNLQDTKYIASFLYNYLTDYLQFAASTIGRKKFVTAVNGSVTSHMRNRWGLRKIRADGDLHHAVDAVVIACTTDQMIREVSGFYSRIEQQYEQSEDGTYSVHSKTGKIFPTPWPNFRNDIIARTSDCPAENLCLLAKNGGLPSYDDMPEIDFAQEKPIFVSRMPRHKVTGPAHKETVKGCMTNENGNFTLKRPLTSLKLDKNGEIIDYYMPQSDTLLYNALQKQLMRFGGNAEKAFVEPFYKPKSDGSQGPLVKKVKLCEKSTLNVSLHDGAAVADHDSMVRIDVFHIVDDGYYFVPIYVADTLKPELPNRAVVAHKSYADWKEMNENDFVFSLYSNDVCKIVHKSGVKFTNLNKDSTLEKYFTATQMTCYFIGASISSASISVINHDNTYGISSLGLKTLQSFEKYQVDILGNISKVKKEIRQTFR